MNVISGLTSGRTGRGRSAHVSPRSSERKRCVSATRAQSAFVPVGPIRTDVGNGIGVAEATGACFAGAVTPLRQPLSWSERVMVSPLARLAMTRYDDALSSKLRSIGDAIAIHAALCSPP